ncbi:MAG: UDP-2,3-diacylglucosamine diphosphatase [Bacteroidia bacterium]|nr:UDP-2,3-diacylglucosamine diphosphatase [Bacteroidia bacterium]
MLNPEKKIFFASDLHLGIPDPKRSREREKHFLQWLEMIRPQAKEIFLLGDLFDFWFEYKTVVPKGFVRILGKLAEIADSGIPIHYFSGNHDLWLKDYFPTELGIRIYKDPVEREFFSKKYFIHHGDGLGPGDNGYKFIKKVFSNKFLQWCFARLHPNFGIGLAGMFSRMSRNHTGEADKEDYGENEFLRIFSRETLAQRPDFDYFVFGHRHKPLHIELEPGKYYFNLGDWISHFTYLEAGPEGIALKRYPLENPGPELVFSPDPAPSSVGSEVT